MISDRMLSTKFTSGLVVTKTEVAFFGGRIALQGLVDNWSHRAKDGVIFFFLIWSHLAVLRLLVLIFGRCSKVLELLKETLLVKLRMPLQIVWMIRIGNEH